VAQSPVCTAGSLPVVYVICPSGHRTGTQKQSGSKMRCSRCWQEHQREVLVTVPSRDGPPPEPPRLGKEMQRALRTATTHAQPVRPVSRPEWVARGVSEITCNACGLTVWRARLTPEAMVKAKFRSQFVFLEPRHADGDGDLVINSAGLATWSGKFPGDYAVHKCPARVVPCKHCSQPIRVLHQPPGSPEILAVLDADEDPDAIVAVDGRGYAVRDPGHQVPGARYRWHERHGRAAEDFRSLMTQRPGGAR